MFISIQQPEFFPWLGFFDKVNRVETVVILDNVQFKKRYFENRNKIRTAQGWAWIRTPVLVKGRREQAINQVRIDDSQPWARKLTSSIRHGYGKAPYWSEYGEDICDLVENRTYTRLVDFNLAVIHFLMDALGLHKKLLLASDLETASSGSDLILEICRLTGAKAYLSGRDGRNYLREDDFRQAGVDLHYQNFQHPEYDQFQGGEFASAMSAVDLLFNHGPNSLAVLTSGQDWAESGQD